MLSIRSVKRLNYLAYQFFASDSVLAIPVGNAVNVKLNRPKTLNSLNSEMIANVKSILDQTDKAPVIVLSGEGGKAFCAGGDVKSLYFAKLEPSAINPPSLLRSFFHDEYTLDYRLANLNSTLVAIMDGIVMGGGVGISVHAPIRIATEKSIFAMPEAKLGLFTDVGGGYFLSRLPQNIGTYIGLTGYRLKGADLVHAGVADHFVEQQRLEAMIKEIGQVSERDIKLVRKIITGFQKDQLPEFSLKLHLKTIERTFRGETFQELYQNLQTYPEDRLFLDEQLQILKVSCPISLRIIFEQIKRGKSLDLKENLKMDYRIVCRMMEGKDFFEGVKQVLIDKNHKPQWTFQDALTIPDQEVEKYFSKLPDNDELKI